MNKDTIYIDIDDEITSIIDKVQASKEKIVALVLPKRATMLQSIVNMKLLKRSADTAKKKVVLITSEHSLLPLAGAVGLHTARTLQSKPAIPPAPDTAGMAADQAITAAELPPAEPDLDKSKPVGELAAGTAAAAELPPEETIEVDNRPADKTTAAAATGAKKAKKKFKIPDFKKFRTRLILAITAVILLIAGWVWGFIIAPRADIVVTTDTTSHDVNFEFTASTGAEEADLENLVARAKLLEIEKSEIGKAPATGEKDVGEKASGEVTLELVNCSSSQVSIPAGTAITTGNLSYVTEASVTLQSIEIGGQCRNEDFPNISTETVEVTAAKAGDQYNVASGRTFSVAGYSSVSGTNAAAMTGGTSKIVKVVSEDDVAAAQARIAEAVGNVNQELRDQLQQDGYKPLPETETSSKPDVSVSPAVGEEASEVTVTSVVVYSMYGLSEEDANKLIEETIKEDIDTEKQSLLDTGLGDAVIRVTERPSDDVLNISLQTLAYAGPEFDLEALRQEFAGQKRSEIESSLTARPGVIDVSIDYSPFWVYSTPRSAKKIHLTIKPAQEANDQNTE